MMNCLRLKFVFFVVFFVVIVCGEPYAKSLKFERFSNKEGFNQNSINVIEQDKYGFLWFGTPNGLIKYDGYEFKRFTSNAQKGESISNNAVKCLYSDSRGILWIGTLDGIDLYVPWLEKFIKVPMEESGYVIHLEVDSQDRIWISRNNKLYHCDIQLEGDDILCSVSENILKGQKNISSINEFHFIDAKTALLATSNGLLKVDFEPENSSEIPRVISVSYFENFKNLEVTTLKKIENIYWLGLSNRLIKATFDGDRLYILKEYTQINKGLVKTIFEDKQGDIWVGTTNELLRYISAKDIFEHYTYDPKNKTGLSSSHINCIYQDNFDVLWIGTAQGGVNKLDLTQKPFLNFAHNPYDNSTIAGNLVNDILEDRTGRLWIACDVSVSRSTAPISNESINNLSFEKVDWDFMASNNQVVHCLFEDNRGFVWMGIADAIAVYNPNNQEIKKIEFSKNEAEIFLYRCYAISQLADDKILLGGDKVFLLHNPWQAIIEDKNPRIEVRCDWDAKGAYVQAFHPVKKDVVWMGTSLGLSKVTLQNNRLQIVENYTTHGDSGMSLSNNDIFSIHEDQLGNLWLGTFGGGLNCMRFNSEGGLITIDQYRKDGVLPDDAVYGIIEEDNNHLWLSTDMGLCRLNTSNFSTQIFDVRDGLPNNNFRQNAFLYGSSGYYYFGGLNGLTLFKPENITINDVPPKVVIAEVSVNNKPVSIGSTINGRVLLKKSISESKEIAIGHKEKTIAFKLVVQHSSTPSKNRIAYMLEGFNDDWIEQNTGKTTVTYTDLPSGEYVFKIRAANGDGLWYNESTNLNLSVFPPWYRTWWSYLILFFLLAGIVLGIFIYFIQLEKLKQSLKYEQLDKKRIDSINQGKLRFFTNISHEFRTPLALIAGPLERIIDQNTDSKHSKNLLIIQNNTKRMLNLVEQLITFRQAEQGHMKLNLSTNTLGNFIYPALEAFEDFAIQKHINFFYKINSPNEKVEIDIEKTERIIFNLLSNSFKYTPASGNISIEADVINVQGKQMISIKVIDNGKGIPAEKRKLIFERFYQLEGREENVGGTGIGLAFCKSLVDLMGGNVSVESEPNVRTCFTVLMPAIGDKTKANEHIHNTGKSFIKDWMPVPVVEPNKATNSADKKTSYEGKLLVVDDEADVREFLLNTLGEKYSITLAENGAEGMEKLKQKEPDLIICDVMMPEMDGFEFCEKVKAEAATCHIPVILLTALEDNENRIKGIGCRADDYISKPFSMQHLEVRVEKLIENTQLLKQHFSKKSSIPDTNIAISVKDKNFLEKVIAAIENNLSNSNFGVEELGREIGASPSQFYRRLKQCTGQIPNVYLRNYRLQKAADLLKSNNGFSICEVMYQIGIESNSYFSTSFKKLHGVSPSEFTRKRK